MADDTQILVNPATSNGESKVVGVSIRGWLAILAIATVCAMSVLGKEVTEPLYTLSVAIIAFYYGQNIKQKA